MEDMCDSRDKIINDHYVLQETANRLEKRGIDQNRTTEEEVLENAKDIELLLYMGKESFINSKQANQNSKESADLHKKLPSITYMAARMPLFFIPALMAFILILVRLSDPMELVRLMSLLGIKITVEAIKESTFMVFLGLVGISGVALGKYKVEEKES